MQAGEFRTRMSDFVSRPAKDNKENIQTQLRESVFFTNLDGGSADLSRSKITNLPGYKKAFLGDNLPVVVVLQGIEVQRLRTENEGLAVRVKEFEHKMFNVHNYEVQIRELTERVFELEREKEGWSSQNQKLTLVCQQLYSQLEEWRRKYSEVDLSLKDRYAAEQLRSQELMQEIEKWRARYMAMEKSKNKELDDLRLSMESQRKSVLDRELRELTIKFQGERGILEAEIRKLRELLESRSREMGDLMQKYSRLEMAYEESMRSQHVIEELENKLTLLSQEVLRLNEMIRTKHEELESLRLKLAHSERQRAEFASVEGENKQLKAQLQQRGKELEEWRIAYSRMEVELGRLKEMSFRVEELQNELRVQTSEREKLSGALRQRLDELEGWKMKYEKLTVEMSKYRSMDSQLEDAENKITMLSTEVQRLNQVMHSRMSELEQWKSRCGKLEASLKSLQMYEEEYQKLSANYTSVTRMVDELKAKLAAGDSERKGYELRFSEYEQKQAALAAEIERLNKVVRGKMGEIEDWRTRSAKLEQTVQEQQEVTRRLKEYENKVVLLTQEIERLNGVVRSKTNELQASSQKYRALEDQVAYFRSQEAKLKEYESRLESTYRSIETLRDELSRSSSEVQRLKLVEGRNGELTMQVTQLNGQINRLNQTLKKKYAEYEELVASLRRYESELQRQKEIEQQYGELGRRLTAMSQQLDKNVRTMREKEADFMKEKDRLAKLLAGKTNEADSLRLKVTEFESWFQSYRSLETQYNQLQSAFGSQRDENDRLRSENSSMRGSSQSNETKLRSVMEQLNVYIQFQVKYKDIEARYDNLYRVNEELRAKCRDFEDRCQDYETRIGQSGQELERLRVTLRGKSAEWESLEKSARSWELKHGELYQQWSTLNGEVGRLRSENSGLQGSLKMRTAEVEQFRLRISRIEVQGRDYESRIGEYESTIAMLSQEIERLNTVLKLKLADHDKMVFELDQAKASYSRLTEENYRLRSFEGELSASNAELGRLKGLLSAKSQELEEYRLRVSKLESEMYRLREFESHSAEYSRKISSLSVEVERLSKLVREREYELAQEQKMSMDFGAQLIRSSAELERVSLLLEKTESEYWQLTEKCGGLERSLGQFELERKTFGQQRTEWQSRARGFQLQIERLQGLVRSGEMRLQELNSEINLHVNCGDKIKILSEEIDRLTYENKSQLDDLERLKLRFSETLSIEKRHEQFCMSFVLMASEVESLRSRVLEKDREVESMRKSMLMSARVHNH